MKNQTTTFRAAIFGGLCLLLYTVPVKADSHARIVRLSQVKGDVKILRPAPKDANASNRGDKSVPEPTALAYDRAILNMPISQGMKVSTGNGGFAEIEFEEGAVLRLTPGSEVGFPDLVLKSPGVKETTVHVVKGEVYFNVNPAREDRFSLLAGSVSLPLAHSAHLRAELGNVNLKLSVLEGALELKQDGRRQEVRKGQEATLDLVNKTATVARTVEASDFDDWNKQRNEYHNTYYSASAYQSYPYYGRGDLNNYGNWYSVPGYGSLWQPSNLAMGWNPFSSGYWSWNPGLGYMWASELPWGWLPYHYGSWSFVPGWGWGWAPGTSWGAPLPLVSVVNPPAGFVAPVPPSSFQQRVVHVTSETGGSGPAATSGTPPSVHSAKPVNVSGRPQIRPATPPVVAPVQSGNGSPSGMAPGMTASPSNLNSGTRSPATGSHSGSSVHH